MDLLHSGTVKLWADGYSLFTSPLSFLVLGVLSPILFWHEGDPLIGFSQLFIDHLNSDTLIAISFFVMAATFMQRGGIAKALVDGAYSWFGGARGGLALVCVLATTVFAAISGSSVATAMAMGTLPVPAMLEKTMSVNSRPES